MTTDIENEPKNAVNVGLDSQPEMEPPPEIQSGVRTGERPWVPHDVEFVSDLDRPELAVSPWGGHRWFAYDLVRWARPRRIVELGTHYGCSYFAFCQALQDDRSDAEVMAIDTWEGEEHSGHYGEEVYEFFTTTIERRFPALNTRIKRSLFDDALDEVEDGSVDILHIDGLHTYEAVSHDYETWKDKVAPNGIVLFHDVAPSSGYGSAAFWQEIRQTGPSFSFLHSFGLGVLLPNGIEGRRPLLDMAKSTWRSYYPHRAGHDLRSRQVIDLTSMVDARDAALVATEELVDARDDALAATERMVEERDELLTSANRLAKQRQRDLAEAMELAQSGDRALAEVQEHLAGAESRLADLQERLIQRDQQVNELTAQFTELEARLRTAQEADERRNQQVAAAQSHQQAAEAENEQLRHDLAAVTVERDAMAEALDRYRRMLRPARMAARPSRRALRLLRDGLPADLLPRLAIGAGTAALETGSGPDGDDQPADVGPQHPLFDPTWYLARYPDVARAGIDPWTHWSLHGWKEGREPCVLFHAGRYLESNPDVATAGVDPLAHWADHGWKEGRNPSAWFDVEFYRSIPGRLFGQDGAPPNPVEHYLDRGLPVGSFTSSRHEERVLETDPADGPSDEVLVDVVLHQPDAEPRSLPLAMVADLDADLFTVDLWDTILTRTRPADSAKLATARRMRMALGFTADQRPTTWDLMQQRVEIEAEIAGPSNGQYLLGDVLARQLTALGLATTGEPGAGLVDHLLESELADEMAGTAPLAETVSVIDKLLGREDARVVVLSDFYLSADDLTDLLSYHGLATDRMTVISSADVELSKHAGGQLFEWIRQQLDIEADRHVHIGDNPHADVAMQVETGGTAIHLKHGRRRFVGPGGLDQASIDDVVTDLGRELDQAANLRCREQGLRSRPEDRVTRAAWRTAMLPVALVAAAIEDASANGLDRIHYLSREGQFLARIHEEVASILAPDNPPDAVHLAVSRRSTFGPSLDAFTPESLLDLWRMYSRQTPRGLLVSLGADAENFRVPVGDAGLDLDETIDGIHLDARVKTMLADPRVSVGLESLNQQRRQALLTYLGEQSDLEAERWLVVDVGWRGTVQDNLARLLPNIEFSGWYLTLFPFLNPQRPNCVKHAIGPDGNNGDEFAFMEPPAAVERPWTPAAPSVVDHRLDPSGASFAVLDEELLDDAGRAAIARYQDAVVEAAPAVAHWIVANGVATDVLRPLVIDALDRYYRRPEPGIADLWFDSAHDDTFGVLNVTSFGKDRPHRSWLAEGPGRGFLRHLEEAAGNSLWPAGYRRWLPVEAAKAIDEALRAGEFPAGRRPGNG